MDLIEYVKEFDILNKFIIKGDTSKLNNIGIKTPPQKIDFSKNNTKDTKLQRSSPESQGISSDYIKQFFYDIINNEHISPHSIMILRNGYVIAEGSFKPFSSKYQHITHSLCKSITCLAVGIAINEGYFKLNDKICDIFPKSVPLIVSSKLKKLEVRHLLNMTSGISFNEANSIITNDWLKKCLDNNLSFIPSEKFSYNSLNSYILGAIIVEKTKMSLVDFLMPRLFKPLGINEVFWEKCPKGIEKGGWGLSITIEAMAKIGQLCLQNGSWEQKQLVPEQWIKECSKKHIDTPEEICKYGYGYHMWLCGENSYQFNGMLGQNVIINNKNNMVIATTCGNEEFFPNNETVDLIIKYFDGIGFINENLREDFVKYNQLKSFLNNLTFDKKFLNQNIFYNGGWKVKKISKFLNQDYNLKTIINKNFEIKEPTGSIFPLFLQVMHNNFSEGIKNIYFSYNENKILEMTVNEMQIENTIPINFKKITYCDAALNDEIYKLGIISDKFVNDEDLFCIKLKLCFVETSNTRIIKFTFEKENVKIEFDELPKLQYILDGASNLISSSSDKNIINTITDKEFLQYKINKIMNPLAIGVNNDK